MASLRGKSWGTLLGIPFFDMGNLWEKVSVSHMGRFGLFVDGEEGRECLSVRGLVLAGVPVAG